MKTHKYLAAMLLLSSCACFAQSPNTPKRPSASGVIGTPAPDIARQIFPDVSDQSNDILIAAASDNDAVRIGVRGHNSTVQVTREGVDVHGVFRVNSIPFAVTTKAPTGTCKAVGWTFSNDGHGTFCDGTRYTTKF